MCKAYFHKIQVKFEFWWPHFYYSRVMPFTNLKNADFFFVILLPNFASTKCNELYTQCLLLQNSD